MENVIQIKNLSKIYQRKNAEVYALKKVSLNIETGELIAITGSSGSGKSTLMNILGCLDVQSEGDYFLCGEDISKISQRKLSKIRNEMIGFIFQSFNLIPGMTALENVELPLIYRKIPKSIRIQKAMEALSLVGLENRVSHKPSELSGGQQQRVAVARAIAISPRIIFADEPTGNLDKSSKTEVMRILKEINDSGSTVVIITHDDEIAEICNRVVILKDGEVIN